MIGLCIKYFHENYGGMLQAYATTQIFNKRKLEYEIIRYEKKKDLAFVVKSIPRVFNNVLINDKYEALQKKISMKKHPKLIRNEQIRMNAFHKFRDDKFKKLSRVYNGYKDLCDGSKKYDVVVTGSDQLWSPAGLPTNFYNLKFVADNVRKVSYASSFGVKSIPWYQKKRTKEFLDRIDYISMRENSGKAIVKELTGRDVPVVLDPVFMFNKEEWENLIPNKKVIEEKYIFAYFLGSNPKYREEVKKLSKILGLKIVTLRHLDQYVEADEEFGDYAPYDVGPEEFLSLLRNAEYVFTDSFHGSVFSIIHKKQFLVFNRYSETSKHSKNSRIDTLCKNLDLKNCRYDNNIMSIIEKPINYNGIDVKLENMKNEANLYLDQALNLN